MTTAHRRCGSAKREPMHGLQVMTVFTLRPDRAALEIASRVYNGNATPRHFLWWANPAVKGVKGIRAFSHRM